LCEVVLVSIIVNCAVPAGCYYIVALLEAPRPRRQPKQSVVKKLYIRQLADEYMNHALATEAAPRSIYSLVAHPYIFVGGTLPMNIF
jgi:hypothetical protein